MTMTWPIITLKHNRSSSLLRQHPWIFSGAIHHKPKDLQNGAVVQIKDGDGDILGIGHYFDGSIAVRILSFTQESDINALLQQRLQKAFVLRQNLGLVNNPETNVYRLVHGEGDGCPGLIIDIYNKTAVIQCHTIGMYQHLDVIVKELLQLYDHNIQIYDKSSDVLQGIPEKAFLVGEGSTQTTVLEHGLQFFIDWEKGQKTGFFIDQRENRKLLQQYVKGKDVINLFSYTGGFSIYAQASGAKSVTSVDASQLANDACIKNFELNFQQSHQAITADAVNYLKAMTQQYDVIVLDPPAFAKHLSAKHKAVQGYKRINAQALKHIKPNGILLTFSCSQVIDQALFKDTIVAAGIEAGRTVKIIHQLSQPEDHPINLFHPESSYLKGLVLYVE
jgi:23S rRNA (cytosine1962-C5)-methyltransferase